MPREVFGIVILLLIITFIGGSYLYIKKMETYENYRQSMGRNHSGHIYGNHCYNYDLMCTIVYNEYEYSEKQQQCNAKDGTNNNVER